MVGATSSVRCAYEKEGEREREREGEGGRFIITDITPNSRANPNGFGFTASFDVRALDITLDRPLARAHMHEEERVHRPQLVCNQPRTKLTARAAKFPVGTPLDDVRRTDRVPKVTSTVDHRTPSNRLSLLSYDPVSTTLPCTGTGTYIHILSSSPSLSPFFSSNRASRSPSTFLSLRQPGARAPSARPAI